MSKMKAAYDKAERTFRIIGPLAHILQLRDSQLLSIRLHPNQKLYAPLLPPLLLS